jgi:hypothetical protein
MKRLLKKILYPHIEITEYAGVTVQGVPHEKVFLHLPNSWWDVSQAHWVLCLRPIVFGVWIDHSTTQSFQQAATAQLHFEEIKNGRNKTTAIAHLSLIDRFDETDGSLLLWKLESSALHHVSKLESRFLFSRYYRKPGFSFEQFKSYVTAYSYPRRVRLISFKDESYFNIFPMDLLGKAGNNGRYVFGLRHTNQSLARIIAEKKMLVSEVPYAHKDIIYQLGKHHSQAPPTLESLPFKTLPSKNFGFPVPAFAESYNELIVEKTKDLGSHMLIWTQSQHEEIVSPSTEGFYHIHFLQHLLQSRMGMAYALAP